MCDSWKWRKPYLTRLAARELRAVESSLAFRQILSSIDFSFPTGLILRILGPFNVFILLNGWICLYGVLD